MARPNSGRGRRSVVLLAAAATGMSSLALLGPGTSVASSHREAPFIQGQPEVDNTDVYAFVSPDKPDTVTLAGNFWPFQEPDGGPNFYRFSDDARYDINVDNDGDAVPDIVYRWTFTDIRTDGGNSFLYNNGPVTSFDDENLLFKQTYDLTVIREGAAPVLLLDDAPVAPSNVGPASMPDYAALRDEASVSVPLAGGAVGQSFAGQADDSFFLDLRVFDLLYGGDLSERGNDTLNGRNVQSLALQVPKNLLAQNNDAAGNPVIGVWSTTSLPQTRVLSSDGTQASSGDFVQVSRLGNPLVNEVVIPIRDKDRFNASTPPNDAQFLKYVQDPEVPRLIESIYEIPAPDTNPGTEATEREDLVEIFLTGVCTGAQGCPSGVPALEADLNSLAINRDNTGVTASEMLRLNTAIAPTARPNRLGVIAGDLQGFPNGRRLVDDVVDIELQVLEGELLSNPNDLSDLVDSNDVPFQSTFPYVALPHNSAVNQSQFAGFTRLAGEDRYGTAAAIARDTFPSADTVLLASGLERNLPDALAGNYLAGFEDAPILLTTPGATPAVTKQALRDLGAQRVIVLGGPNAVSAAQFAELDRTYDVTRVGGRDRYETAAKIATTPPTSYAASKTAIVARGDQFPDALVAGPLAFRAQLPILLTRPGSLDGFTRTALSTLGIEKVIVAGGPQAVSEATAGQLADARGNDSIVVTRVAGADRRETAVAIAKFATGELGFPRLHADLARGDLAVDALAGGPHAGKVGGVILLTEGNGALGAATARYLAAESITLERGHVFGGPVAVSSAVVAAATDAANSNDPNQDPAKQ